MTECPAGPGIQRHRWNLQKAEKTFQICIPNPVFYSVVIQGATEFCYPRRRFTRFDNWRIDENHATSSFMRSLRIRLCAKWQQNYFSSRMIINPKHETRNSKQSQMTKFQMFKTKKV